MYRIVHDVRSHTGEGPLWHPDEQRLYWLDIPAGTLFRYTPASSSVETFELGAPTGGMTIQRDGSLLLFMAEGAVRTWRDGRWLATVIESLPEERGNRFNDVIADPEGRVFCGVMSTQKRAGRLYRLDTDGRISVVLEDVGTSNGMGFPADLATMYFTDTRRRAIDLFDYDRATGAIERRRPFVRVPENEGRPDGLTVDCEDCVWSAQWDGAQLVRYAPDGTVIARHPMPVKKVSSLAFGGADWGDVFITTAGGYDTAENGAHAGALFSMRPGVGGRPEFRSAVVAGR